MKKNRLFDSVQISISHTDAVKRLIAIAMCITTLLIPLASPTAAAADAKGITNPYMDKISKQYTECATYFAIVSHAYSSTNKLDDAQNYKQMYTVAMKTALSTEKEARNDGMAHNVIQSRYDAYMLGMLHKINDDFSKVSALLPEYDDNCKQAVNNPETFINSIINSVDKKHKK